jgi:hypothetical protein
MTDIRVITVAVILLAAPVILGIDYLLYLAGGNRATISRTLLDFSKRWPIVPLLFGVGTGILLGHLFVPQHVYVFLPIPIPW